MNLSFKDKVSDGFRILCYYGLIMFMVFLLSGLNFSLNGWVMNGVVLAGYMWADITLLKNELIGIIGIFLGKVMNILLFVLYFATKFHSFKSILEWRGILFAIFSSAILILMYWRINKKEENKNVVLVLLSFFLGVVLYGYVGLRCDFNNHIKDEIFNLGMEVQKVERMLKDEADLDEITSALNNIDFKVLDRIDRYYLDGNNYPFKKNPMLTTVMSRLYYNNPYNSGWENREFLKIICSRYKNNIWKFYDEEEFTPRKVRTFFKEQDKYTWVYPKDVKPGVHNLIYEWSKEDYYEVYKELMLIALASVDFTKLEEVEKIRGKLDLYEEIVNFNNYDSYIMWCVYNGYKNSYGENKEEIEKGLIHLYSKEKCKELMDQIADHNEEFKELLDKFERGRK
ncbi:hypothetical protein [Oceanirhabdus seepicola]|uniref:Uncharacterized protein n=1 Tax=Oceanirhabdus seepicola TaxID=2828781 RepID=A0A9J6P2S7_9CLOT|nr:hypothetical protein [Oceanirhabdus seepicola]MCM1990684.1 hypothetical protein [Oceanirhabdus seepicola]